MLEGRGRHWRAIFAGKGSVPPPGGGLLRERSVAREGNHHRKAGGNSRRKRPVEGRCGRRERRLPGTRTAGLGGRVAAPIRNSIRPHRWIQLSETMQTFFVPVFAQKILPSHKELRDAEDEVSKYFPPLEKTFGHGRIPVRLVEWEAALTFKSEPVTSRHGSRFDSRVAFGRT